MKKYDLLFGHSIVDNGLKLEVIFNFALQHFIVFNSGFVFELVQISLYEVQVYLKNSYFKFQVGWTRKFYVICERAPFCEKLKFHALSEIRQQHKVDFIVFQRYLLNVGLLI